MGRWLEVVAAPGRGVARGARSGWRLLGAWLEVDIGGGRGVGWGLGVARLEARGSLIGIQWLETATVGGGVGSGEVAPKDLGFRP